MDVHNDKIELHDLKGQIERCQTSINSVITSQALIAKALLGELGSEQVGLLEEGRALRKESDANKVIVESHTTQINELQEFRRGMMKMVAGIALIIPVAFEILKAGISFLVAYFTGPHKP